MYSVEANTQTSKGVTERRGIKASVFTKRGPSLKGLYIVMISRFPEFLLELQPDFCVCTKNTPVAKCWPKRWPLAPSLWEQQKIRTHSTVLRLSLFNHSSVCTVQVSAWRGADEETSEDKVWNSIKVTTTRYIITAIASADSIKSNFQDLVG